MTYRCFAHADVEELAKHATVPVINALPQNTTRAKRPPI